MGTGLSKEIDIKMRKTAPAAATPAEAKKQAEALKEVIVPGLLRSCVENWLPERDGGLSSIGAVRYYLDPGVKVLVSYEPSQPEPRVKGSIRIYKESKIED